MYDIVECMIVHFSFIDVSIVYVCVCVDGLHVKAKRL